MPGASAATLSANVGTDIFSKVPLKDTLVGPAGTSFFAGAIVSHEAGPALHSAEPQLARRH